MKHNWIRRPQLDDLDNFHGSILGYECTRCGKQSLVFDTTTAEVFYFYENCDDVVIESIHGS